MPATTFIPRTLRTHLEKLSTTFPAISLTGPRQSGKTTLLREMFADYAYVSFENPRLRLQAQDDPEAFLAVYSDRVIFDEAQRFPELFSYLQGLIDEDRRPGRFILSGSQNFLLRKGITQSLAGRVGIARLLPLTLAELSAADRLAEDYETAILRGGYPAKVRDSLEAELFYSSYLASYVERDVNELVSAANLDLFQRFIITCATYAGQVINLSKIAKDSGVSPPTVRSWLGILEQSYVIFRLKPFFRNIGKQLTKAPKLYFYDTGLLAYLLGLYEPGEVSNYARRGALFENLVIADAFKSFYHLGHDPRFYFYRDQRGTELDLLYEKGNLARMWEIKAGSAFHPRMTATVEKLAAGWDRPVEPYLLYAGSEERLDRKTQLVNWRNIRWER